jgi:hypothetical protein
VTERVMFPDPNVANVRITLPFECACISSRKAFCKKGDALYDRAGAAARRLVAPPGVVSIAPPGVEVG